MFGCVVWLDPVQSRPVCNIIKVASMELRDGNLLLLSMFNKKINCSD